MIKFYGHKIYEIELPSVISQLWKKFIKRDIEYWIIEV